jgi:hypothetical protein
MIVDITELFTVKRTGMNWILNWLHYNVGEYIGSGNGFDNELMRRHSHRETVLYIGKGWQISAIETVDGYGHMLKYELDITDDKLATFFILKFL